MSGHVHDFDRDDLPALLDHIQREHYVDHGVPMRPPADVIMDDGYALGDTHANEMITGTLEWHEAMHARFTDGRLLSGLTTLPPRYPQTSKSEPCDQGGRAGFDTRAGRARLKAHAPHEWSYEDSDGGHVAHCDGWPIQDPYRTGVHFQAHDGEVAVTSMPAPPRDAADDGVSIRIGPVTDEMPLARPDIGAKVKAYLGKPVGVVSGVVVRLTDPWGRLHIQGSNGPIYAARLDQLLAPDNCGSCVMCDEELREARVAQTGSWFDGARTRMILCPECGNKRCPKANDHRNACTHSNEPGQPGSAYPAMVEESTEPAPSSDGVMQLEVDLLQDGLLWLINSTVFHPRGFALAYSSDGKFTLQGNGDQPWAFEPESLRDEKFAAVERIFERVRSGRPANQVITVNVQGDDKLAVEVAREISQALRLRTDRLRP